MPQLKANYTMLVTVRLVVMFKVFYCIENCRHLWVADSLRTFNGF